ncbi:MAG: hypothetical protein MUO24_12730 [Desulfobacterales bacterium]|nr:hypothetical protein [Desulfobacterales bacterium]
MNHENIINLFLSRLRERKNGREHIFICRYDCLLVWGLAEAAEGDPLVKGGPLVIGFAFLGF